MFSKVAIRLVAVFIAVVVPNAVTGLALGVAVWKSAAMTGAVAVLGAVQALAEAYRKDGNLSAGEIDEAMNR